MIYKFECREDEKFHLEFSERNEGVLEISISNGIDGYTIELIKKDVFKLIGALYCIQKEMK